jgi:predicted transcriptional regulator
MGRVRRTVTFEITPLSDVWDDFTRVYKTAAAGQPVAPKESVGFTSLEVARRVLTPQRLALLHAIRAAHPRSIYGLAKLLRRDLKAVQHDLALLEGYGLVTLTASGHRRAKVPTVPFREIALRIAI